LSFGVGVKAASGILGDRLPHMYGLAEPDLFAPTDPKVSATPRSDRAVSNLLSSGCEDDGLSRALIAATPTKLRGCLI
jgi:hypothetical protein